MLSLLKGCTLKIDIGILTPFPCFWLEVEVEAKFAHMEVIQEALGTLVPEYKMKLRIVRRIRLHQSIIRSSKQAIYLGYAIIIYNNSIYQTIKGNYNETKSIHKLSCS